jgi:hypothetical protein
MVDPVDQAMLHRLVGFQVRLVVVAPLARPVAPDDHPGPAFFVVGEVQLVGGEVGGVGALVQGGQVGEGLAVGDPVQGGVEAGAGLLGEAHGDDAVVAGQPRLPGGEAQHLDGALVAEGHLHVGAGGDEELAVHPAGDLDRDQVAAAPLLLHAAEAGEHAVALAEVDDVVGDQARPQPALGTSLGADPDPRGRDAPQGVVDAGLQYLHRGAQRQRRDHRGVGGGAGAQVGGVGGDDLGAGEGGREGDGGQEREHGAS